MPQPCEGGLRLGLRKTSAVDYPGRLSAVLFFPGCNLRCPWCHNPELVNPAAIAAGEADRLGLPEILSFLEKRRNVLGGVVLSGGEPTLHSCLGELAAAVRSMGYPLKLDTNGTIPGALRALLADEACRPDYIALDLKLPPRLYGRLGAAGEKAPSSSGLAEALEESCRLIAASGIPHEYRTLVLPAGSPSEEELREMARWADGAAWYFASFRAGGCLDPRWNDYDPPSDAQVLQAVGLARSLGKAAESRSAHPS